MHDKNSQFILLKIPPHLVSLLGKIHALSIEVLPVDTVICFPEIDESCEGIFFVYFPSFYNRCDCQDVVNGTMNFSKAVLVVH